MLIDQKRAHERVLYERFLECLSSNRAISQVDLFPVTAELNPSDYFILKEIEKDLGLLGFSFSYSGKQPDYNKWKTCRQQFIRPS